MTTAYNISIVSDTVCPWCYVGRNRLQLAIKQHQANHPKDTFEITWHPFYLNPDAPRGVSIDKQTYYERKFGAPRTSMMQSHMARVGKQVGINFAFGGKTGNTRDSHRLIALGGTKGPEMQDRVVKELFNAYFESEEDITDVDMLIRRGVKAGLDEAEVKRWMENGDGGDLVDREVAQAQAKFISGVPNFTINGVHEVNGAEEPMAFLGVFDDIKEQSGNGRSINGGGNTC